MIGCGQPISFGALPEFFTQVMNVWLLEATPNRSVLPRTVFTSFRLTGLAAAHVGVTHVKSCAAAVRSGERQSLLDAETLDVNAAAGWITAMRKYRTSANKNMACG